MKDLNPEEHFQAASKLASKEYSQNISKGEIGYLPSLEGLLDNSDILTQVNLGLIEIPIKKIKGTYSHLRSLSFAKNFMPLLNLDTEFKYKWMSVCEYHLNEGIKDPIKVYEYLNWFYVIEGNKRVSVLKYFDGYSIDANVIRLVPKQNPNDPVLCLYYEFLDFNRETDLNCIWFSKTGCYTKLMKMLKKYNPSLLDFENKYKYFEVYTYNIFRNIYHALGGDSLPITTGDAFLEYSEIYGIPEKYDEKTLRDSLKQFIKELRLISSNQDIEIQTSPMENQATGVSVLSSLTNLFLSQKPLKVAFAHARNIHSSGWTYAHELGRMHAQNALKDLVVTTSIEDVPPKDDAYFSIKSLVEEGNEVIFTTSPIYFNATLKCALEYPKVKFFNCSEYKPYSHVSNYFGRTYEPRFLTGLIAGSMTKTNVIGYVATAPNPEVISSINAFALGVKLVNPYSKVKISWTNEWHSNIKSTDCSQRLIAEGADIISNQTRIVPMEISEKFGIYSMLSTVDEVTKEPDKYLAAPIWHWGVFYEKILKTILHDPSKNIADLFGDSPKAISLWWGMSSGVLDIYCSKHNVPYETHKLVNLIKNMIIENCFNPFTGPIYDNKGYLRIEKDCIIEMEEILSMDWFVDNVDAEDFIKR
ncbi:BMP family ABC transporter substrate-binding protein [Desnuesiella massiliensis]|uniref:BMP family ABC transporter substrate-binding protein n=1 Tax=Desnuesiella massiliensis TaxID=1650662 RepID=UPI0006E26C0C|nr:BMP family ABC transporter substrate-binding protein [Desnuesiella massiliensis]